MAKVKDLMIDKEETQAVPEQTVEEFLEVMSANREGFYVNIGQPNENAIMIINSMNTILLTEKAEEVYSADIVKAAKNLLMKSIKSLKLESKE